jgi:hypothetical protein
MVVLFKNRLFCSIPKSSKENQTTIIDELVKSRHSRAGGNPGQHNPLETLDSRFNGQQAKQRKKI